MNNKSVGIYIYIVLFKQIVLKTILDTFFKLSLDILMMVRHHATKNTIVTES